MISFEDAEKALNYRAHTDAECARLKGIYEDLSERKKVTLNVAANNAEGSAAARLQVAYSSKEYQDHLAALNVALIEFETMKSRRATAEIKIEMWRSINSSMRRGNIQ